MIQIEASLDPSGALSSIKDILNGAYAYVLDNQDKPIMSHAPRSVLIDPTKPYFTNADGFRFPDSSNGHKWYVTGASYAGVDPKVQKKLSWEIIDGVVGALFTWMRAYGWGAFGFAIYDDDRRIGYGFVR